MAKLGSILSAGARAMMNSQAALTTVGHNIANKDTEGYSRQRVEIQSNTPISEGKLRFGTGAKLAQVTRINNPFVERQLFKQSSDLGFAESQAEVLGQVEQIFNEAIDEGLNSHLNQFFNSFRELANNPESIAARTIVRDSSDLLTKNFQQVTGQLRSIQERVDFQIQTQANKINNYLEEIAELNKGISNAEIHGGHANDERDRRDLILKNLGKIMKISHAENNRGQIMVSARGGTVLVSGFTAMKLSASKDPSRDGLVRLYYKNSDNSRPIDITNMQNNGSIGGVLAVRDKVIGGILEKLDGMVYTLASEVNKAHRMGFDRHSRLGQDFFQMPLEVKGAASKLHVSRAILDDAGRIAVSSERNAPANNDVAHVISHLQHKKVMDGGNANVGDFYNSIVSQAGLLTQRATRTEESQKNILNQLENVRESISGVSLDEETTKMIEYQKSFAASAKLIQTADEMFDTVLNLKR